MYISIERYEHVWTDVIFEYNYIEQYIERMPKQVIVSMQKNYPFGECEEVNGEMVRVYVRKVYKVSLQEHDDLE